MKPTEREGSKSLIKFRFNFSFIPAEFLKISPDWTQMKKKIPTVWLSKYTKEKSAMMMRT